jgi:hypothetical protein
MLLPRIFRTFCAAVVLLCTAAAEEADTPWNLERAHKEFTHSQANGNLVSLVYDGWNIALLSHNRNDIGAIFFTDKTGYHQYRLVNTAKKLVRLLGMKSPMFQELEEADEECAIVLNGELSESLAADSDHALASSPLAGMAYLLQDGYFYIAGIKPDGRLHWKTVKKSNVELLMPMSGNRLQAIEVTGRQRMNEFASEVLARKLGFGSNTASESDRDELCRQHQLDDVPYMNTKAGIITARRGKKVAFGKTNAVLNLLSSRNSGDISYPEQASAWPEKKVEVVKQPEPAPVEEKKEIPPLTPQEARKAYAEYLRSLFK